MLEELSIHNYKSLRNVSLERLPPFAVFVGANASGKSNFSDALDFLSLTFRMGLSAAVRAKGGYENVCFRRARRSKGGLRFAMSARWRAPSLGESGDAGLDLRCQYRFAFRATTQAIASEYRVEEENLAVYRELAGGQRRLLFTMERGEEAVFLPGPAWEEAFPSYMSSAILGYLKGAGGPLAGLSDELVVQRMSSSALPQLVGFVDLMQSCRAYQFWPQDARRAGVSGRSPELGRSGENLPGAFDYVRRNDPEAFDELVEHLRYTVPTMERVETAYVDTKELGLFFKESGVQRRWFSMDVSDGTMQTVSLFLALLDRRVRIMMVEEPENSLHPWILKHFMKVAREKSSEKQIMITTQSPIAVDSATPESLYLVERDKGETRIARCDAMHRETREALRQSLMGMGEYWVSGGIGAVPGSQMGLFED